MRRWKGWRSLLAALLFSALMLAFCPSAFAYGTGQFYEGSPCETMVSAVQIAASKDYYASCVERDEMVLKGYDCYIVNGSVYYHIMCGKFRDEKEAKTLRERIVSATKYTDAFVTHTYLPDCAIEEFEIEYFGQSFTPHYPVICQPEACQSAQAQAFGPAGGYMGNTVPAAAGTGYTATAYAAAGYAAAGYPTAASVSLSATPPSAVCGAPFEKYQYFEDNNKLTMVTAVQIGSYEDYDTACSVRDGMSLVGYDCYVYCRDNTYYVMCGKFNCNSDAEFYRKHILVYTDYTGAVLDTAYLPPSSIYYFVSVYYGLGY